MQRAVIVSDMIHEPTYMNELSEAIKRTTPEPLSATCPPDEPGMYLLVYAGDLTMYAPIAARWPIYTGSTGSLRGAITEHREFLMDVENLSVDEFSVVAVPAASLAGARYLEYLARELFHPVWNEPWLRTGAPLRTLDELLGLIEQHLSLTVPADSVSLFAI